MGFVKTNSRGRIGQTRPASYTLVKAISSMREKNYRNSDGKGRYNLTARELVVLGRLITSWKDIVGLQMARKTYPARLIKGRLYLTVADSQWMQTLVFLKVRIIEKLNHVFPDFNIEEVVGRPGHIPQEIEKLVSLSEWPDYEIEAAADFTHITDPDLQSILIRCNKKLKARLKGLEQRGMVLCEICRATVTVSSDKVCAMCKYENRREKLSQLKRILFEMPWLKLEELSEIDSSLNQTEYQAIRLELLESCLENIEELFGDLFVEVDHELVIEVKKEMTRAVMLYSCKMPDQVDLDDLDESEVPGKNWDSYLRLIRGVEEC